MRNKIRILLAVSFVLGLSWNLLYHVTWDLAYLGYIVDHNYLGDLIIPRGWVVSIWILQIVIIVLGTYAILTSDFKKLIPKKISSPKYDISLKYQCNECLKRFPDFAKSINIKEETESKFCPACGAVQKTQKITIKKLDPISYDIRTV